MAPRSGVVVSAPTHRTCARCGAQNEATARHCERCGQALPRPEDVGRFWTGNGDDPSTQVTAPFQQPRPYTPPPERRPYESSTASRPLSSEQFARPPLQSSPAAFSQVRPVQRRGPRGCFLGGFALLLILAVLAALIWTVSQPLVSDRVSEELNRGIATQVAAIDSPRLQSAGRLTVTEEEINREVASNESSFDPVENVQVRIVPEEVRVTFDLYGSSSTLRGGLAAEGGRVVVVDPTLSGVAGRVMDVDDVVSVFEEQLANLMDLSELTPTAVDLNEGEVTITTRRGGR